MRIIKRAKLVEFWQSRKGDARDAERSFSAWYEIARRAEWKDFGALKQTFGTADAVGNCVVFDVGNNRFRLIGRVNYRAGVVYLLSAMDHKEYDKGLWADGCGCHLPPPKRAPERARRG